MEYIRALVDIYEKLYALSIPMADFINTHFNKIDKNAFNKYIYNKLPASLQNFDVKNAYDLDIYYQCQALMSNWTLLYNSFHLMEPDFFDSDKNSTVYNTIQNVQNIRNETMHPKSKYFFYEKFIQSKIQIEKMAKFLNTDIKTCLENLHAKERNKILNIINSKVIDPALASNILPENIRTKVEDTKKRLASKATAKEIIDFYDDALMSEEGSKIHQFYEEHNMASFESIKEEIDRIYFRD